MSLSNNFPTIKPSLVLDFANTKALDPRVTFTRSTTATYYDGVTTAKAEENLLLQSQTFENASWLGLDVTVTANTTTAPDGTSTADTLLETATTNRHRVRQAIGAAGTYTVSVFAKPNGRDFLCIAVDDGNTQFVVFNLATGTVGTSGGSPTNATITASTNGFYRCSVTLSGLTTVGPYFHIRDADSAPASYAGDITKGLFLWGAQLEQRSSVTAYTATTTQAITNYIPVLQTAASGVPRFDHNPVTDESLGLLIEEQRTNLLTYSAQFDNAVWTKVASTVTANATTAPDGTTTADKIVEDTSANVHGVRQDVATSAVAYGFSVYAKPDGRNWFYLYNTTTNAYVYFNISSGVVGTSLAATGSISPAGNGWYRCTIITTATAATNAWRIYLATADGVGSYTGDGFSGILVWGAQLEAGAFATSYIPTVASTVTRNADAASMTGTNFSSWYAADQGTMYVEGYLYQNTTGSLMFTINDGTTSNRIQLNMSSSTSQFLYLANGVIQAQFVGTLSTLSASNKMAFAYKVNDYAGSVNAGTPGTDTSGVISTAMNQMQIGSRTGTAEFINSTIKKIAYYPLRVTNAQLQALTS